MVFALGPVLKVAGVQVSDWPLPYAFVHRLPFYEWVRIPARMDMMIKFALAMLAAMGTAELVRSLKRPRQVAVVAILSVLILFEYWTFSPYPTAEVAASPFLEALANDGQEYGILTVGSHEYAMYLQTLHGHPMVEGHIHRWPPGGIEWALQLHGMVLYPPESEQPYWDILDEELPYGRDGADIFAGTLDVSPSDVLSSLNIRYVVFDRRGGWTPDDKKLYRARLREYFGDPVYEDDRLTFHEVPRDVPGVPKLTAGTGWYPLEGGLEDRWRFMDERATVQGTGIADGMYRLLFVPRPDQTSRHLAVGVNGDTPAEYLVQGGEGIITPPFQLSGEALIDLQVKEGCPAFCRWAARQWGRPVSGVGFQRGPGVSGPGNVRQFGDQVALVGYETTQGTGDDHALYVSLYWQALGRMDREYTVFVHGVDAAGARIVQTDDLLASRDGRTTSAWGETEGVRTLHRLELPPEVDAGALTLKVGVYDVASMERLPLAGDESGENVVIVNR